MVEVQTAPQAMHQASQQDSPDISTSTVFSAELSTINSQLLNHGWTKRPLDLSALGTKDHNEVVSVLFELLGSSVANVNNLEAMATRHRTLQYEFERIQKVNHNLKSTNTKLQQETNGWKVKCIETEKKLQLEEGKTKELREEIGRGRKALEGVRVAATHETKKIQLKLDKSLLQLSKQSENPQQRSTGLVLLNPIPAGRTQPVASTASPLLEQTLRDLTDIRESLQEETEAFRHVVVSTGNALREALAASQGKEAPARLMQSQFFTLNTPSLRQSHLSQNQTVTFQSSSSTSHPSIANTRLQSLISEVRSKLTENVPPPLPSNGIYVQTPEEIEDQKRIEREQEKFKLDLEDKVKDLQVELICAKRKEEEASKVVEEMARKELEAATAKGDMEGILAKQLDLMEIERRAVNENKERLEKERKQLEIEKQKFQEEKRQAELDAVLALIPTPSNIPSSTIPEIQSMDEEPEQIDQLIIPSSPGPSTYQHLHKHLPHSPSPLSPLPSNKLRTPKNQHHVSSKNRRKSIKTPLSRLVLEKAVRQKSKDSTFDDKLGSSVLGNERGRKTNLNSSTSIGNKVLSPSRKGKEKEKPSNSTSGLGIGFPPPPSLMKGSLLSTRPVGKVRSTNSGSTTSTSSSSTTKGITPIASSTLKPSIGAGMRTSLSGSTTGTTAAVRKVDMNKIGGIGPMAARKSKGTWK